MKTITITQKESTIKMTLVEYNSMREKLIDNIMLNTKKEYPEDAEMIDGVDSLCIHLRQHKFDLVGAELVRGLSGFIYWASMQGDKITRGWILTNCIHDLGEFKRNKHEDWFSPRTSSYDKFLN